MTTNNKLDTVAKAEIAEVCARWNMTQDDGDVDQFMSLWSDEPNFVNPFGTFTGRDAIHQFTQSYVTGFASGKRHMRTNISISGENGKATSQWDALLLEVRDIPHIVATMRATGELISTADGWKLQSVKLHIDDGFGKLMESKK